MKKATYSDDVLIYTRIYAIVQYFVLGFLNYYQDDIDM